MDNNARHSRWDKDHREEVENLKERKPQSDTKDTKSGSSTEGSHRKPTRSSQDRSVREGVKVAHEGGMPEARPSDNFGDDEIPEALIPPHLRAAQKRLEEISDEEFIEILERTSSGNPYGEGLLKAIKQNRCNRP